MWTSSPLKDLVVEDGRVVGVVVVTAGKDVTVRARKGVILSSGGFDRSPEMRHAYQSEAVDGVVEPGHHGGHR